MTAQRYTRQGKVCPTCERKHFTLKELDRGTDECRRCRGWYICRDCHQKLPNDEYHKRGDGRRVTCKDCHTSKCAKRARAAKLGHKVATVQQHGDTGEELRHFMRTVKPTEAEMRLIRKAVARYGKQDPSPGEVLGMERRGSGVNEYWVEHNPPRPGIWSIVALMAQEATPNHLTQAA